MSASEPNNNEFEQSNEKTTTSIGGDAVQGDKVDGDKIASEKKRDALIHASRFTNQTLLQLG